MTSMAATTDTSLTLKRIFAASREQVFRAWTDPAELKKWWGMEDDWSTPISEVDLRVGGKYRLGMLPPGAESPHVVYGTYREVEPPDKLVYTWQWEGGESDETLVTVRFHDMGDSTEVELTHSQFPSAEERDKHNEGWNGCLQQLAKLF